MPGPELVRHLCHRFMQVRTAFIIAQWSSQHAREWFTNITEDLSLARLHILKDTYFHGQNSMEVDIELEPEAEEIVDAEPEEEDCESEEDSETEPDPYKMGCDDLLAHMDNLAAAMNQN